MKNLVSNFKGRTLFGCDIQKRALVTGGWISDNVKGRDLRLRLELSRDSMLNGETGGICGTHRLLETWIEGTENRYTAWKS